jgi:hypothetical protein
MSGLTPSRSTTPDAGSWQVADRAQRSLGANLAELQRAELGLTNVDGSDAEAGVRYRPNPACGPEQEDPIG